MSQERGSHSHPDDKVAAGEDPAQAPIQKFKSLARRLLKVSNVHLKDEERRYKQQKRDLRQQRKKVGDLDG
jgi:hypothetical protein